MVFVRCNLILQMFCDIFGKHRENMVIQIGKQEYEF